MLDEEQGRPERDGAGKLRVLRARCAIGRLVARIGDPARARRLEAELNDAWLRLQFALVAGDEALVRAERRACAALLLEARRCARNERPEA